MNRAYAQVIAEKNASDVVAVEYVFGDDLLAQNRSGTLSNYHYDGLGSTRALTDSTGNVSDEYFYDAFGVELARTGSTENDYLFTGEQYDAGLGNYYLRARYYDQNSGRFTQQDTWMGVNYDPITLHKYLYANADPVTHVDPTGNFSIAGTMKTVGVLSTLTTIASNSYEVFQLATGEKEFSAREFGTNVLLSALPGGAAVKLYRKTCKRNSFVEGTLVQLKGNLKPIEGVDIGDLVLSYNEETGQQEYKEVTHIIEGEELYTIVKIELENGEYIESTDEHPFYVDSQWINAIDIETGDKVLSKSDKKILVSKVSSRTEIKKVYNLTIADNHNYYVGEEPVLVHNAMPWCKVLNSAGKVDRSIDIDPKKLQKKWKHAKFFGIEGNFNKANGLAFKKAIEDHVAKGNTIPIPGKYRGDDVIHFLDPKTGINVMKDLNGKFVSGWKLGQEQIMNVTKHGGLN